MSSISPSEIHLSHKTYCFIGESHCQHQETQCLKVSNQASGGVLHHGIYIDKNRVLRFNKRGLPPRKKFKKELLMYKARRIWVQ